MTDRRRALAAFWLGALGQILAAAGMVFLLRRVGAEGRASAVLGVLAIVIGGTSSALWGILISAKYRRIPVKKILTDFVGIRQPLVSYLSMLLFLLLDFCYVLMGGSLQIQVWYMPFLLFLKAILFGGIEEIGWRYTFQPILEEKLPYIPATLLTFLSWGVWHFLYFYIDGSIYGIQAVGFLMGLLTSCFLLSALFHKTGSLWICVMAHALINTFSQLSVGGSPSISLFCKGMIIFLSIRIGMKKTANEKG